MLADRGDGYDPVVRLIGASAVGVPIVGDCSGAARAALMSAIRLVRRALVISSTIYSQSYSFMSAISGSSSESPPLRRCSRIAIFSSMYLFSHDCKRSRGCSSSFAEPPGVALDTVRRGCRGAGDTGVADEEAELGCPEERGVAACVNGSALTAIAADCQPRAREGAEHSRSPRRMPEKGPAAGC